MFPPAPLALIDSKTGGIQTPQAGVLGSHDSATGAPEKHKGEAVEQEAHNFVSGIGSIALSSAAGKHEQADPESDPLNSSVPDPTNIASDAAAAKQSAQGSQPEPHHDKTKQPMEQAMWLKMRPVMHVIGDIADGWERFAKCVVHEHSDTQILTSFKCVVANASISTGNASLKVSWRSGSSHCRLLLYFVGNVHEDGYWWDWLRLFR